MPSLPLIWGHQHPPRFLWQWLPTSKVSHFGVFSQVTCGEGAKVARLTFITAQN